MTMTPEEKELIPEFRRRIEDLDLDWYGGHDTSLLRWLRARNLDLSKAEAMLRKHMEWRRLNNMDAILSYKFPENITNDLPFKVCGTDAEGCMVVVVPFGQWDICGKCADSKKDLVVTYVDYLFEVWHNAMRATSTPNHIVSQSIIVLDYAGFSLRQITSKQSIDVILQILHRLEANQPEILKYGFIVNAPRIFELLFRLCKPIMTARTLSKLFIFGQNSTIWRQELLKVIPHDSLPSQYGGSHMTFFNYHLRDGINFDVAKHESIPDDKMETVELGPGQKFKFDLKVMVTPGQDCVLKWSFKTDNGPVGFRLNFSENCDKSNGRSMGVTTIIECAQADAHLYTQNGKYFCRQSGTYSLFFENFVDRASSKMIKYAAILSHRENEN